ncbi:MAG: hypothetical protein SGILL_003358 [Bacillariaceae sp.]
MLRGGDDTKDVYTKKGLQAILGIEEEERGEAEDPAKQGDSESMSQDQMEVAMASLEDEDDVKALRGAQKEASEDLKEFDENAEIEPSSDKEEDEADVSPKKADETTKARESLNTDENQKVDDDNGNTKDLEMEFAAWQSSAGFDGTAIEDSLSPMERYGLRFREDIDPFYSVFFINEERRKQEALEDDEEIDVEELEKHKAMEEKQAMEDGDLLATWTQPEDLTRQRNLYRREKARLRSDKKRRKLTGDNWSQRVDGLTQQTFWYNEDTGEAIWDTPRVVANMRADAAAEKEGWGKIPLVPLVKIMDFLCPFDRQACMLVCVQWRLGANDFRFVRHVYPVEMGILAMDKERRHFNHFVDITDAIVAALPGDTVGKFRIVSNNLLSVKRLPIVWTNP